MFENRNINFNRFLFELHNICFEKWHFVNQFIGDQLIINKTSEPQKLNRKNGVCHTWLLRMNCCAFRMKQLLRRRCRLTFGLNCSCMLYLAPVNGTEQNKLFELFISPSSSLGFNFFRLNRSPVRTRNLLSSSIDSLLIQGTFFRRWVKSVYFLVFCSNYFYTLNFPSSPHHREASSTTDLHRLTE